MTWVFNVFKLEAEKLKYENIFYIVDGYQRERIF